MELKKQPNSIQLDDVFCDIRSIAKYNVAGLETGLCECGLKLVVAPQEQLDMIYQYRKLWMCGKLARRVTLNLVERTGVGLTSIES